MNIRKTLSKNKGKIIISLFLLIFVAFIFNSKSETYYSDYLVDALYDSWDPDDFGVIQEQDSDLGQFEWLFEKGYNPYQINILYQNYPSGSDRRRNYAVEQFYFENLSTINWNNYTYVKIYSEYQFYYHDYVETGNVKYTITFTNNTYRITTVYYYGVTTYKTVDTGEIDWIIPENANMEILFEMRIGHNSLNSQYDIARFKIYFNGVLTYTHFSSSSGCGFNPFYIQFEKTKYYTNTIHIDDGNLNAYYMWYLLTGYRGYISKVVGNQVKMNTFIENFPRFTESFSLNEMKEEDYGGDYWEYSSNQIKFDTNKTMYIGTTDSRQALYNDSIEIVYERWEIIYPLLTIESHIARFPIHTINASRDWGDWGLWNFAREVLAFIVNVVMLFFQFIAYCVVLAFNWILIWLIIGIIGGFFWNFLIFWGLYGILWVVWFIALFILFVFEFIIWIGVMLWNLAMYVWNWLWNEVIVPLWEWFWNTMFPICVEIIYAILAWILAILIWTLTLGTSDFMSIYNQINDFLHLIGEFLFESILFFVSNIPAIILSIVNYLICIGLLFERAYYCKSRGYIDRAERLEAVLSVYMLPIHAILALIGKIYSLIGMGGSENE